MTAQPRKPLSNTALAVEKLRALIFDGTLGPGTDHLESELAQSLGLSRTPVREALLVLESQGLLSVRPRKGVRITPISSKDMAEIYDVLTALESLAARRAAEMRPNEVALAPLTRAIEAMEEALHADDLEAWAVSDDAFHRELVALGGNERLSHIVTLMSDQVRRARLVTLHMRPKPSASNSDHRAVLYAIREGDGARAAAIHTAHRDGSRKTLVALLEKHQLKTL